MDNVTGGTGPDVFAGTVNTGTPTDNTYSTSDVVDGGAGTDTLQITVTNSGSTTPTTFTPVNQKVETVRLINIDSQTLTGAHVFDANVSTALTKAEAASSTKAVTFDNLANPATVSLSASANTADVTFKFKATSLTGTADNVNLSLTSNGAGSVYVGSGATLVSTGIESVTVDVSGTNAPAFLIGTAAAPASDLKSITVTGSGSLVVPTAAAALSYPAVNKFDASANTGGVRFASLAVNSTIMGGGGADTLTGSTGNDTITGGAGADTITAGAGNDSVDAGAGNDTVTLESGVNKNDTITGGDGTDVLILASALGYSSTSGTNDGSGITGFETVRSGAALTTSTITQNMKGLATGNTFATAVIASGSLTLQESPTIGTLTGSGSGTFTIGLATNGTGDTLQVNMSSTTARAVTVNANEYETINVAATGIDGHSVTLGGTSAGTETVAAAALAATASTSLTSMTITGSKSLTVDAGANALSLATVDASGFTGSTLSFTASSASTKAINIKANGAYGATITAAKGADTITLGDPGTSTGHSVTAGDGADTVTSGSGNDTIAGGDGNNVILGGAGNDSITGGSTAGDDWFKGEAGDDTLVGNIGADTLEGGDGNDSLNGGAGADSIIGGDGNDNIDSGSGSDFVSGGTGADTINAGAGDDTVDGGAGNDVITIASLTSGDSIDGGDGTADRLTLTTVASDATPSGITNIEDFRIDTFGVGASTTGITVDFNKVSGITSMQLTNNTALAATNTLKALPTALKTINMADSSTVGTDVLALTYSSGPSSLTVNSFGVRNAATNITSLNAPLTINGKLTTNIAGDAQVYTGAEGSYLGAMTTDASTITLSTDALAVGAYAGSELGVGTITDTVLQSLTVSAAAYTDIAIAAGLAATDAVANVSTTNSEFSSLSVSTGTGGSVRMGTLTADSATAVAVSINPGTQGSVTVGNMSVAAGAIALSGTIGDQATPVTLGTATGKSITSSNFTSGAGTTVTLPSLLLTGTASSSNTIGAVTLNAGVSSSLTQSIATSGTAAASVGAITAQGSGTVVVNLGATQASSNPADTALSSVGAVSASGMTSPLSSFQFNATSSVLGRMTITGGSGNDSIVGGAAADTITGGLGQDSLNGGSSTDVYAFSVGDSNPVSVGAASNNGQDRVVISSDIVRLNITTADTKFVLGTHVTAGSTVAGVTDLALRGSYADNTLLVQTGAPETTGDNQDIVLTAVTTAAGWATADPLTENGVHGVVAVNLTGTAGNDTLQGGANTDTISGGDGNDLIIGDMRSASFTVTGAGASETVTATVNGVAVTYAVPAAGATVTSVAAGLASAINSSASALAAGITGASSVAGVLTYYGYRSSGTDGIATSAGGTATFANSGAATVVRALTTVADSLVGGNGNDTLLGGGGADTLSGGNGNDLVNGGADKDRLTGGDGVDTFQFDSTAEATVSPTGNETTSISSIIDSITDFVAGSDSIRFSSTSGAFASSIALSAQTKSLTSVALTGTTYANFTAIAAAAEAAVTGGGVATSSTAAYFYLVTLPTQTVATGFSGKTFLVLNDATAAIAVTDTWIDITGVSGTVTTADIGFGG